MKAVPLEKRQSYKNTVKNREKKQAERGELYSRTRVEEEPDWDEEFLKMFYGETYTVGIRTRKRKAQGLTTGCYLTQRLLLIRYAIIKMYREGFIYIQHGNYEQKILNLISGFINYANTLFEEQEQGVKVKSFLDQNVSPECVERIRHLTRLSSAQFYFKDNEDGYKIKNCEKLKCIEPAEVEQLFMESTMHPIPLAFGIDQDNEQGGMYDIDHWFTLFNGKLYGAAGLDDFNIKFSIKTITPEIFYDFLQSMCEPDAEKLETFKSFLRSFFVSDEDAIVPHTVDIKTQFYALRDDVKEGVKQKIDNFVNSFTLEKLHDYNIFKQIGYGGESYIDTLQNIITCVQNLPFLDADTPEISKCIRGGARRRSTRKRVKRRSSSKKRQCTRRYKK